MNKTRLYISPLFATDGKDFNRKTTGTTSLDALLYRCQNFLSLGLSLIPQSIDFRDTFGTEASKYRGCTLCGIPVAVPVLQRYQPAQSSQVVIISAVRLFSSLSHNGPCLWYV